ncbi:MAG: GGDEF domain-containing protein [Spirochaetales bacterium]|nr:GGDEF domain-containing protein [Spirochaetales bacterium]
MEDKYLLICTENLDSFSLLFQTIKKKASFKVEIVHASDILEGKYTKSLKSFRISDIFIAIEGQAFSRLEPSLRDYCNKLEEATPFTNFLYLYKDMSCFEDSGFINGNKQGYILFENDAPLTQAIQFIIFMINLYNKAVLANRLADYIYHSFKEVVYYEMLKKQKMDIEELNKELAKKNKIDNLTNIYNRRALFEFLEKEKSRTLRNLQKLGGEFHIPDNKSSIIQEEENHEEDVIEYFSIFSIMMIDLDHFKKINDTHGHLVGDKVLKIIGNLLQKESIFRDQDIAGRFGGEEFIVILPNTNANNALGPAMRLAEELSKIKFASNDNRTFKVTLSIGISEYHPTDKDNEAIIYRADQAMYYAKEHGRNQIIIYEKVFDK